MLYFQYLCPTTTACRLEQTWEACSKELYMYLIRTTLIPHCQQGNDVIASNRKARSPKSSTNYIMQIRTICATCIFWGDQNYRKYKHSTKGVQAGRKNVKT